MNVPVNISDVNDPFIGRFQMGLFLGRFRCSCSWEGLDVVVLGKVQMWLFLGRFRCGCSWEGSDANVPEKV